MLNPLILTIFDKNSKIMGKNKKKLGAEEAEWKTFVNNLLARKRAKRPYLIPLEYLTALADRIHSTSPTLEVIRNSLVQLFDLGFTKGYSRRLADAKRFKEKQTLAFEKAWGQEKDYIDDIIHAKSNIKK